MRTVRWMAGTALLFVLLAVASGYASSLNDSSKTVGANKAAVASCDANGFATLFNYSATPPFPIVSVTVSGIASACGGQTLQVTVSNATTNSSGSTAVPAGGGSVTVTLSSSIAESDSTRTDRSVA
jgi:hypothetical protein